MTIPNKVYSISIVTTIIFIVITMIMGITGIIKSQTTTPDNTTYQVLCRSWGENASPLLVSSYWLPERRAITTTGFIVLLPYNDTCLIELQKKVVMP